ncbi:MAG: hypothetical protein GY915_08030 [bacterium]|nr:hypothetical protein [bacterium]
MAKVLLWMLMGSCLLGAPESRASNKIIEEIGSISPMGRTRLYPPLPCTFHPSFYMEGYVAHRVTGIKVVSRTKEVTPDKRIDVYDISIQSGKQEWSATDVLFSIGSPLHLENELLSSRLQLECDPKDISGLYS